MVETYLDTINSIFYNSDGYEWRDGLPRLIVGGHEKIKVNLVSVVDGATPSGWERDTSWGGIDGINAMLTIDNDYSHKIKGTLSASVSIGDNSVQIVFSGNADLSSVIPTEGIVRLFSAFGDYEAIAYTQRAVSGKQVTFTLGAAVKSSYSAGDVADCGQSPLASAYLNMFESDWNTGTLVFDLVCDSIRLRGLTEYQSTAQITIEGIELLLFSNNADSVSRIRAFLWDSASLHNTQGDPGYEADPPDPLKDKLNSVVAEVAKENLPTINSSGNWVIGGVDTGISAKGEDGDRGQFRYPVTACFGNETYQIVCYLDAAHNMTFAGYIAEPVNKIDLYVVSANTAYTGNIVLTVGAQSFTVPVGATVGKVTLNLTTPATGIISIIRDTANAGDTLDDGTDAITAYVVDWSVQ